MALNYPGPPKGDPGNIAPAARRPPNRTPDRIAAAVSPLIVYGMFAYSAYVITSPLILNYLVSPAAHGYRTAPQISSSIGLAVPFAILWLLSVVTYTRLLSHVIVRRDVIPPENLPPPAQSASGLQAFVNGKLNRKVVRAKDEEKDINMDSCAEREHGDGAGAKPEAPGSDPGSNTAQPSALQGISKMPDMSSFYSQDIFVCEPDGLPKWCSMCQNYKSARGHHDSRSNNCVHRLDHFCPWIGGPVGESNYKFFVQFLFWLTLYTILLVVSAINYVVQQANNHVMTDPQSFQIEPNFVALLALSFFFFMFVALMGGFHLHLVHINISTIEDNVKHEVIWRLAVRLNDLPPPNSKLSFRIISFPLVPDQSNPIEPRHFGVLISERGDNPFDLGGLNNFKSVLGNSIWEWFLPFTESPLCSRRRRTGMDHQYGSAVKKMIERTGVPELFVTTNQLLVR